jgi:hypothetical protein
MLEEYDDQAERDSANLSRLKALAGQVRDAGDSPTLIYRAFMHVWRAIEHDEVYAPHLEWDLDKNYPEFSQDRF